MARYLLPAVLLAMLSASFAACNNDPEDLPPIKVSLPQLHDTTAMAPPVDTAAAVVVEIPDKDAALIDSMMHMEVTLPPILDESAYDTATVNNFTKIASLTKGGMKLLASADLLEKNISDIICKNSADYADILFLVDNTGSMGDDIVAVKEGMNQIIDVLRDKKGVRLAIATYRDKQYDSSDWFAFRDFETDYAAAKKFTDSMSLKPNEDLPESVYEAFIAAAGHKFWRSRTKRIVLIIGDARPKEKSEGGEFTMDDMLKKAAESRIKVNFFPLIVTPYSAQYRAHDMNPQPATETHIIEQIFPNPTSGIIQIKMAQQGRYRIAVYSMTGVLVEDRYIDDELWMIDMRVHEDGLYVIRVTDKNNQYDAGKFILRR